LSGSTAEPSQLEKLRPRVVGHPTAPIGMGEHVRSVWQALHEAGTDAEVVDIYGPRRDPDPEWSSKFASAASASLGDGANIFCINGDEIAQSFAHLQNRNLLAPGSRNIIYPAWELERYPEEWAAELNRFDEVWAPSAFIRDAVAKAVKVPVVTMPLACEVARLALMSRRHFGIRESAYVFLFSFDFLSYIERKNPFAVIEAFRRLLARKPHADVVLVLKTNNANRRPDMKKRFDEAVAGMGERVLIIDGTLPELEIKSLVWLCDCFVSLHRSEGFGRGLSEAMALSKPVIATGYSGNMEFCNPDTAYLVPYELIPVGPNEYPHWQNQRWADPSVEHASAIMERLVDDPQSGRILGQKARANLLRNFSYLSVGTRYAERLSQRALAAAPSPAPTERVAAHG
jgi:glycosyltransferase involved in cell wall biosynthesis